jgi:hypothetical protein
MLEKWNDGMAPFGQINAWGWRAKTPPQAVKPLSVEQRFSFSFLIFNLFFPLSIPAQPPIPIVTPSPGYR